jgi:uncharacterized protein (TIGR03437 family)
MTPGGGLLPADAVVQINGSGFDPGTTVSIDDVSIALEQYISPQQLELTLGAQTEMTGKHVHVMGSAGGEVDFFPSLPITPAALPNGFALTPEFAAIHPLLPLAAYTAGTIPNNLIDPPNYADALALLNPNPTPVTVILEGVASATPTLVVAEQTLTVPAGTLFFFDATSLVDATNEQQLSIIASAPVRMLEFVYYDGDPPNEPGYNFLPVTAPLASPPMTAAIVNGASLAPMAIAPGEIVTLFGSGIGAAVSGLALAANGTVSTTLDGTQILINGINAPLVYASPSQVNAVVPYEVGSSGIANIQIQLNGVQSAPWGIPIASASPAVFTVGAGGVGQGAALNQDNSVNGASNPAARGSVIQIYATGGGLTSPAGSTGSVTKVAAQLALPVTVAVGGVNAQVLYAGSAPGEVEGVVQVNVVVPANVTPGAALPLLVTVGGVLSQAGVTVAVL